MYYVMSTSPCKRCVIWADFELTLVCFGNAASPPLFTAHFCLDVWSTALSVSPFGDVKLSVLVFRLKLITHSRRRRSE